MQFHETVTLLLSSSLYKGSLWKGHTMINHAIHHAKYIDSMNIGDDFGEDGGGWGIGAQDISAKALTMIFQSLPETRRAVRHGNTSFVGHSSYFSAENKGISSAKSDIIRIDPTPFLTPEQDQALIEAAVKALDPETFATLDAQRQALKAEEQAQREALEQARQQAKTAIAETGDRESITESFIQQESVIGQKISKLSHEAYSITRDMERIASQKVGRTAFHETKTKLTSEFQNQQAQPFMEMLDGAGIAYKLWNDEHEGATLIELDQTQPDFVQKLSTLVDQHKAAILEHYKDVNFIIIKPDGTALDKTQAAEVIAARSAALDEDAKALRAAAEKYGVVESAEAKGTPAPTPSQIQHYGQVRDASKDLPLEGL